MQSSHRGVKDGFWCQDAFYLAVSAALQQCWPPCMVGVLLVLPLCQAWQLDFLGTSAVELSESLCLWHGCGFPC